MKAEEEFPDLASMSSADLDREIQRYRAIDAKTLSETDLRRICAIHAFAARRNSGPPKTSKPASKAPVDALDTLFT
jgi:hypothetical protein